MTRAWLMALAVPACATHETILTPTPMALAGAPLAWPPTLADLTWIEGRWAGRDDAGVCHIEHWLGARAGLLWHIVQQGDALSLTAVRADDARIGTRELVLGERRYTRSGDQLRIDGTGAMGASLWLGATRDLRASCPPPSP